LPIFAQGKTAEQGLECKHTQYFFTGEASMARLKRGSVTLDKAMRRIAGMRSINGLVRFSDGLSLAEYDTRIQALQSQLSSYNTLLSGLDEMAGRITLMEQELGIYSEKMLMGVATRYGKDSLEYMQAGGTQRRRTLRRPSDATPADTIAPVPNTAAATNGNGAPVTMQ